jgi:N-acetylmuramoyl-L-alanine amidase
MMPRTDRRSPNFEDRIIPVEFLLLHNTAGDLERALSIFEDKNKRVSCHLLVAENGEVFELVSCWSGKPKRAAHAGASR